uniref:C2H2-type domain-containing protein n=1 Tax=Panagrellus redivivus TaxID=6233 RepID=A0A7E4VV15_PANRE
MVGTQRTAGTLTNTGQQASRLGPKISYDNFSWDARKPTALLTNKGWGDGWMDASGDDDDDDKTTHNTTPSSEAKERGGDGDIEVGPSSMGRRKQSNPLKVSADGEPTTPKVVKSASPESETAPPTPKRSKIDFSIAAQLESANKPSTSTSTDNGNHHSLQNALKAYETLLSELNSKPNGIKPGPLLRLTKQVDQLASRDGKRNPATESALDLRVKRASNSAPAPGIQVIPVFKTPTSPLAKKPSTSAPLASDDDSLRKLSSLVGKAGSTMSAHMAAVVKSAPHELKDDNDPCTVFTCLQCFQRFDSMQELTEHMRKTQHLSQQLTSGKLPYCNGNGLLELRLMGARQLSSQQT